MRQPQFVFIGDSITSGNPQNFSLYGRSSDAINKNIPMTVSSQFSTLTGYKVMNLGV